MDKPGTCRRCGKACEEDEIAPLIHGLTVHRTGDMNVFDFSEASAATRAVMALANPRIELCTSCFKEVVHIDADFIDSLLEREVTRERVLPKVKEKILAKALADEEALPARITARKTARKAAKTAAGGVK